MEIDEVFKLTSETVATMKRNNMRYMDWERAKAICEEHKDCCIYAGLKEDMGNTEGLIYDHGEWCKDYVYDQSFWATPILEIWPDDGEPIEVECWTREPHENTKVPNWWGQ